MNGKKKKKIIKIDDTSAQHSDILALRQKKTLIIKKNIIAKDHKLLADKFDGTHTWPEAESVNLWVAVF